MIVRAPASLAAAIAAFPTPPHPNTATESSRPDVAGVRRRTEAGHHATPEQSGRGAGDAAGSTFVAWPAATNVFSANAPMPSAGDSGVPSARVIGLLRVVRREAVPRSPAPARPALAAHRVAS